MAVNEVASQAIPDQDLSRCLKLAQQCWNGAGACRSSLYPFCSHDLAAVDSFPWLRGLRQGHAGVGTGLLRNPMTLPVHCGLSGDPL